MLMLGMVFGVWLSGGLVEGAEEADTNNEVLGSFVLVQLKNQTAFCIRY